MMLPHLRRRGWHSHHLHLEGKLQEKLLGIFVPMCPELGVMFLYLSAWNFKCDSFVGLSCKQQVLPSAVWWLDLLFISWHESVSWLYSFSNFCNKINYLYGSHLFSAYWIWNFVLFICDNSVVTHIQILELYSSPKLTVQGLNLWPFPRYRDAHIFIHQPVCVCRLRVVSGIWCLKLEMYD